MCKLEKHNHILHKQTNMTFMAEWIQLFAHIIDFRVVIETKILIISTMEILLPQRSHFDIGWI